jgi:hypothetical protein
MTQSQEADDDARWIEELATLDSELRDADTGEIAELDRRSAFQRFTNGYRGRLWPPDISWLGPRAELDRPDEGLTRLARQPPTTTIRQPRTGRDANCILYLPTTSCAAWARKM